MEQFWSNVLDFLTGERAIMYTKAATLFLVGLVLARFISAGAVRLFAGRSSAHHAMLLRRVSFYLIAGLFLATALMELGFDIGVLLGAAGILTIALGFASQTSASNVISGLFLLGEKPFALGDIIKVDNTTGEVISIDLLSVKLRTFNNLFVRVPNESIIKSQIVNMTRFPIRRIDLQLGVAYKENLNNVIGILNEVADRNPLCLQEPRPLFIFQGFGDSSLNFQYSVWVRRECFLELRTGIQLEIKEAFDRHNIEIPFPHRTIYTGSITEPFPVQVVQNHAFKEP